MELGQGTRYKGYTLWQRKWMFADPSAAEDWGAYTSCPSTPWFKGQTPEEVVKLIDAAYAELPDPVY